MTMSAACSFIFLQFKVISITLVFALRLALEQRHKGTRKWPIQIFYGYLSTSISGPFKSQGKGLGIEVGYLFQIFQSWARVIFSRKKSLNKDEEIQTFDLNILSQSQPKFTCILLMQLFPKILVLFCSLQSLTFCLITFVGFCSEKLGITTFYKQQLDYELENSRSIAFARVN